MELLWCRILAIRKIVYLDESTHHRPVLISLCFLCLYQVGQRHEFDSGVMDRHCCATTPQLWKRVDTAHLRHDINPHASRLGVLAPKMDRVTLAEIPWLKWWNGNNVCIQV